MKTYSALAKTKNGAQEGFVGTKQEIDHWLAGWADPENLYIDITDEQEQLFIYKPFGLKTIPWRKNKTHIAMALENVGAETNIEAFTIEPKDKGVIHIDCETLENKIDEFMQKHIFDSLRVTIGTIQSYIDISANLKLPTAFLEHIQSQLQLLLDGENL